MTIMLLAGLAVLSEGTVPRTRSSAVADPTDGYQIYWGDIHGHTGFSDGYGLPDEYFYTARYSNNLDFAAISDHANAPWPIRFPPKPGGKSLWELTVDAVNDSYDPGNFVTMLGFEWTSDTYGHRNVYFRDTEAIPDMPLGSGAFPTPYDLWNALSQYEAFTVPHHTMRLESAIDTSYRNDDLERLVEIHSKWGSSERPYADYEPMLWFKNHPGRREAARGHSVADLLSKGFKLGIIGGTDTHQGLPGSTTQDIPRGTVYDPLVHPQPVTLEDFIQLVADGYTRDHREPRGGNGALLGVFSHALTRADIWDALYSRHVYASTGSRAELRFWVVDTMNGDNESMMGDEFQVEGKPELHVRVLGDPGSTVQSVQIIRDGMVLLTEDSATQDVDLSYVDAAYGGETSYYLVRVFIRQAEEGNLDNDGVYENGQYTGPQLDERLWSSPIWVSPWNP